MRGLSRHLQRVGPNPNLTPAPTPTPNRRLQRVDLNEGVLAAQLLLDRVVTSLLQLRLVLEALHHALQRGAARLVICS